MKNFFHVKSVSNSKLRSNQKCVINSIQINYATSIFCQKLDDSILFKGPLGSLTVHVGDYYVMHSDHSLTLKLIPLKLLSIFLQIEEALVSGFTVKIIQSGVWNQFTKIDNVLKFQLGFSHPVNFNLPQHVLFQSTKLSDERHITLFSINKSLVTQTAAKLVHLKPCEPYKGTGFKYANQFILRKVGKKK